MTDAEYLRLFEEGRHGSNKPAGILRGIRKCIAASAVACERCGEVPETHTANHWCDNQSFAAPVAARAGIELVRPCILQEIEYASEHGWPQDSLGRLVAMTKAQRAAIAPAAPAEPQS